MNWFDELPEKMIPSDEWLMRNKLDSKISVESALIDEKDNELNLCF